MSEFFSLPKQIQLGQLMRFLSIMIGSAVLPFMSMYYAAYFGTFWTGLLIVMTQIAGFVSSLYGGHLSDVLGRKKIIQQGYLIAATGWLLTIIANLPGHSFAWLTFLGVLAVTVGSHYFSPAFDAMVIDLTNENNRRFVYTIGYWLINIAVMLGAGIAGLFYDHHFFELLIGLFVIEVFCYIVVVFYFDETRPETTSFAHGQSLLDSLKNYREVLLDRPFLAYTAGIIFYGAIWAQVDNYLAVHLKMNFQTVHILGQTVTGAKMLSIAVLTNTLMIVLWMTVVNRLTKSLRLIPQLILGGSLFALGMLLAFRLTSLFPLVTMVALYTVGEMIYVPASQVLRADMMDSEKIGSYSGLISMAGPVGNIIAGGMISLSYFTGVTGVQLLLAVLASGGLVLMVIAAKMKGLQV